MLIAGRFCFDFLVSAMPSIAMPLDQISCAGPGPGPDCRAFLAANQCAAASPYETSDDSAFGPAVMWSAMGSPLSGQASAERAQ
jgi:hypothetical protein